MKRQRGRNRKPGGNQGNSANPNRSWDSQGPENIKVRGNAQTVYERYQQLARDATSAGDRVLAENYLQHAEHYFRVLRALQPQRSFQEIAQREQIGQGFDIDFEDESGAQAAAFLAAQQAADRQAQQGQGGQGGGHGGGQGQGGGDQPRGEGQDDTRNDRGGERNGDDNRDGGRRETRRERWERRRDERRNQYERDGDDASASDDGENGSRDATRDAEPSAAADDDAPRPARRARTPRARAEPQGDAGASDAAALPGFLTRPTAAASEPDAEGEKPAPRRRAPRRKAEDAVSEEG